MTEAEGRQRLPEYLIGGEPEKDPVSVLRFPDLTSLVFHVGLRAKELLAEGADLRGMPTGYAECYGDKRVKIHPIKKASPPVLVW